MEHPFAAKLRTANLQRTKYLLAHFPQYSSQSPLSLDEQTSKAVLEILAYHFQYREVFTQADRDLINHCGPLLIPATRLALEEMREFPVDLSSVLYPILYHQYFSPEGTAVDLTELLARLKVEELSLDEEKLRMRLQKGEQAMSALLFSNRFLSSLSA